MLNWNNACQCMKCSNKLNKICKCGGRRKIFAAFLAWIKAEQTHEVLKTNSPPLSSGAIS